ncbi:MAG: response regulator [Candidatus Thiodiazotropha taylori]
MTDVKPRILIVDDEPFYTEVLCNLLYNDYEVLVAETGKESLKMAFNEPHPELILLDILLPDIDGYEVCYKLKEDPTTAEIPIIFLTAKSDVDDEVRGFNLGAVDYITKPISPPIVQARVRTHIRISKMIRQLETIIKQFKGD